MSFKIDLLMFIYVDIMYPERLHSVYLIPLPYSSLISKDIKELFNLKWLKPTKKKKKNIKMIRFSKKNKKQPKF